MERETEQGEERRGEGRGGEGSGKVRKRYWRSGDRAHHNGQPGLHIKYLVQDTSCGHPDLYGQRRNARDRLPNTSS